MESATALNMCQRCGKVGPISDHMNETGTIFKWCVSCRQRGRARSRLRRDRKKAVIASFQAQAQANPHLTQFLFHELAASNRSAFSRRDQIRLLVNPPPASTFPKAKSTDTLSTSLETETESVISESDQAKSSRAGERFYSPEQFHRINPFAQPDAQLDAEEGSDEDPSGNIPASTPTYFFCIHCGIARKTGLEYSGICVYCLEYEQQYCIAGDHEADRRLFTDTEGNEQSSCRNCRERDSFDDEMEFCQESDDE